MPHALCVKVCATVPDAIPRQILCAAAKAFKCDEFITAEKPDKRLHKARGLKVRSLPTV